MENKYASDFLNGFDDGRYPEELVTRYEALECLSHGEGCETLLVCDRSTGKQLVAKCYDKGHVLFNFTEPEELRKLSHPGLPAFEDELRSPNMRCILREYVAGQTLCALAREDGFTPETVRRTGMQLCGILKYLHSRTPPVIHRDIKPQNVVIREDGSPALIDLGISRLYAEGAQNDTVLCGTQDFAPPEQYGFLQTDSRSDIYSLGMLLGWMLTGKTSPLQETHTPLERVIARCTAFAPDDRLHNASAVRKALANAGPAVHKRRILTVGTVCVLVLMCIAFYAFRGSVKSAETAQPEVSVLAVQTSEAGFTQPAIEQAVRLMLGKDAEDPLSEADLASVTSLYITRDTPCKDIQSFYETHNKQCSENFGERGTITSLEDLKLMPNLQSVFIATEQITDITPLASLKNLLQIELRFNDISDITPLATLKNLSGVGLNSNPVTDISPLAECKSLSHVDLCDANDYNPSAIALLGDLEFLDISNQTDSYLYLSGKSIVELKLSRSSIKDLSVLDGVSGLKRLEMTGTQILDISALKMHPELSYIRLTGTSVTDFSVLLTLPELKTVAVSAAAKEYIEPIAEQGKFEISYE